MGLFFNNYIKNILNEAEVDGQSAEEENSTDYTTSENTDQEDNSTKNIENEEDKNTEKETNDEDQNNDSLEDDEQSTDYTSGVNDNEDSYTSNEDNSDQSSTTSEESKVDDIKKQEEEIYNSLTPEQLDIKHKELKTRFLDMYDMITTAIDRIGDVVVSEEDIEILEYVSTNLFNLKDMISDYINSVYQTKSYIENSINYNRFIAVLNGICRVLEEMNAKNQQN